MYNQLNETLATLVSPERLAVLIDSRELLHRLGWSAAEDELQQILEISTAGDSNELVHRVGSLLHQALTDALREMGVTLKPETPLAIVKDMLLGLLLTEQSAFPEDLVNLLESELDAEELIATLIAQATSLTLFEVLDHLDQVHADLPQAIRRRASEQQETLPPESPDPVLDAIRQQKLNQLRRMRYLTQGEHPTQVFQLSRHGVRLGAPLSLLVEFTLEALEPLANEALGQELLGLVLYSNTPTDAVSAVTEATIVDFIGDAKEAQRAVHGAQSLLRQLEVQS